MSDINTLREQIYERFHEIVDEKKKFIKIRNKVSMCNMCSTNNSNCVRCVALRNGSVTMHKTNLDALCIGLFGQVFPDDQNMRDVGSAGINSDCLVNQYYRLAKLIPGTPPLDFAASYDDSMNALRQAAFVKRIHTMNRNKAIRERKAASDPTYKWDLIIKKITSKCKRQATYTLKRLNKERRENGDKPLPASYHSVIFHKLVKDAYANAEICYRSEYNACLNALKNTV